MEIYASPSRQAGASEVLPAPELSECFHRCLPQRRIGTTLDRSASLGNFKGAGPRTARLPGRQIAKAKGRNLRRTLLRFGTSQVDKFLRSSLGLFFGPRKMRLHLRRTRSIRTNPWSMRRRDTSAHTASWRCQVSKVPGDGVQPTDSVKGS